ncbi:hypothetical protein I8J29_08400 [Paenibacillus sp. MWE-103]|uniref:Uncharacterized protein n=1 Tax=Paenibacillus artemisiicola TaxID=1172618 RepID=A0ABS3W7B9_9BACL|nr:hypothetical protein [Paenibacillus artemisiicola]MBO7744211.1 hypothetical protein [Paenibacillus artemisiicola]
MMLKIAGVALLFALGALYEWPKLKPGRPRERRAFALLSAFAAGLLLLVLCFPELPGPNKWMIELFKPMRWMLER